MRVAVGSHRFEGKRQIPFLARDHEISHRGDITGRLRAKETPEHIRKTWPGTCWIIEIATTGTRDSQPFNAKTSDSPTSAQPQPSCNCPESGGALKAGTGFATPTSMGTPTATEAMALV